MRRLLVVSTVLALTGAGAVAAPAAYSAPAPAVSTISCPVGWGSLPENGPGDPAQPLTGVRTGRHDCYDRIVLDVPGSSAGHPVGYAVRYVPALVQDGSGAVVPVGGGAVLEIVATAPAYDPVTGAITYGAKAGQALPGVDLTGYRTFRDAKFGGSFEGRTQLGLGVRARLPFRVFQLDGRLVVDVAHSWNAVIAAR